MKPPNRRASSRVLIIGAMTAEAPASRSREAVANSPTGMRAIAGFPAAAMTRDRPDRRGKVDGAVLHVEGHRIEGLAGEEAGDGGLGHPAPGREGRRARLQAIGEGGDGRHQKPLSRH